MANHSTDAPHEGSRFQYRLRSLFLLTTSAALTSGLAHYLGGTVLLKQACFILFTIFVFLFLILGPLLVTEFLTWLIDVLFGFSATSPMPGRRRIK